MPSSTEPFRSGVRIFAVHLEHDVHSAYFLNIFAVDAVQPQDLGNPSARRGCPPGREAA